MAGWARARTNQARTRVYSVDRLMGVTRQSVAAVSSSGEPIGEGRGGMVQVLRFDPYVANSKEAFPQLHVMNAAAQIGQFNRENGILCKRLSCQSIGDLFRRCSEAPS